MTAHAQPRQPSELARLVAAELRLDGALAIARSEAAALIDAARGRAAAAAAACTDEVVGQQAEIIARCAAEIAEQRTAIAEAARSEIARYEAVCGDVLVPVARALAAKLAVLARAEASSS